MTNQQTLEKQHWNATVIISYIAKLTQASDDGKTKSTNQYGYKNSDIPTHDVVSA